jgi:hypothetical protein
VNAAAKLTGFAVTLAVLFAAGSVAGNVFDASPPRSASGGAHGAMDGAMDPVRGLAVAEHGLRLVVANPAFAPGRSERLRFRIVDDRGETVRDFDVEHTKRMHLIVVRRDLTNFQHVHPTQDANGVWTVALRLDAAGSYRVFADFSHDSEPTTLASDLRVDGAGTLASLPAPNPVAVTDGGYTVRLAETEARAGNEAALQFSVRRNGKPVTVEPYLGANGHLVALREGDLAFLHVHPTEGVRFESTFPTTGRYRLFLQFKHEGRVHTAAFTQVVS